MEFLNAIRLPIKQRSKGRQILVTVLTLLLGVCLGIFSKHLDFKQTALPSFLRGIDQALELHTFLDGFAPWILIAVCIAIYNKTPLRAAINVFVFFVGMVAGYYWYGQYYAGFFPRNYAVIWAWFTVASPFLAAFCWYAKGNGWVSCLLSAGIVGVLFNTAFVYGITYFNVVSWLNVSVLGITLFVLRRNKREMFPVIGFGVIFAIGMTVLFPFRIW